MLCSMEERSPLEMLNVKLRKKAFDSRKPLSASLEITSQCNLRCNHCYVPPEPEDTNQVLRLVDRIADVGVLWLVITGGEPLLRQDILDICRYVKHKGLFVMLFTNATLVTPKLANDLAMIGPYKVEVSAYGRSQHTYETITGVPGSFEAYLRGIRLLKSAGIPLALKSPAFRTNQLEILQLEADCCAEGIPYRLDPIIWEKVDGDRRPCDLRLTAEEIVALDVQSDQRRTAWVKIARDLVAGKGDELMETARLRYSCAAGRLAFDVDSSGTLRICRFVEQPKAPFLSVDFWEVWDGEFAEEVERERPMDSPCVTCHAKAYCDICSAFCKRETGDPDTPPREFCDIAFRRAVEFGRLVGAS